MKSPVTPHRIAIFAAILTCTVLSAGGTDARADGLEFQHRFRHLTLEDGLSQSSVNAVLQDRYGFVWLGTQDGLNRYDGHGFVVHKSDPDDPHSLVDAYITCLAEGEDGSFWIGTDNAGFGRFDRVTGHYQPIRWQRAGGPWQEVIQVTDLRIDAAGRIWVATSHQGLICYDPGDRQVRRFRDRGGDVDGLPSDEVLCLLVDRRGTVWAGTGAGLAAIEPASGLVRTYAPAPGTASGPGGSRVTALIQTRAGDIWLGTDSGLDRFLRASETFEHHLAGGASTADLRGVEIQALAEGPRGRLWLGGEQLGLLQYDPATGQSQALAPDPYDRTSLNDDRVHTLYVDAGGVLWVGHDLGVSLMDGHAKPFYHYRHRLGDGNCLSNNSIWSFCEDRQGRLWVATSDGVNLFDPETGSFATLAADPEDPRRPALPRYTSLLEDREGSIWLGFAYGGLERYDPGTGIFTRFETDSTGRTGAPSLRVYAMAEAPDGRIWMGTFDGVQSYDPRTGAFTNHDRDPDDPVSLGGHSCRALDVAPDGTLWLGTWGDGVVAVDPATGRHRHFRHDPADPRSLTNDTVISLAVAHDGHVWIGSGSGLNRLSPDTGQCVRYTETDGLPNNTIYGIVEDASGMIWVGTNFGLVRLHPQTLAQDHFRAKDGVQSNEFNMGACLRGRSGLMYFGGINGFNAFYPDSIRGNDYVPPVVITEFRVFNKPVLPGEEIDGRTLLERPIFAATKLPLSYRDDVISFSFSALHYAAPEKNRYAYILEGFDSDWNEVGNRRHATYTNLPPGEYVFRVRGTNNDGIWNESGASVAISIEPPFWQTPWFVTLSVLLALTCLNGVIRYRTRLMNIRTRELEARVTQRTSDLTRANHYLQQEISERRRVEEALRVAKEQAEAATRAKSEFLANMSHEIRTPMNGVLGMTSILLESDLGADQREHLEVVYASARNLLSIINDILDFSKIEAGKLELECIEFEPREVVEDVGEMLALRAHEKNLQFTTVVDHSVPGLLRGDPGRLRQILLNLANNAVKFTDAGRVEVRVGMLEQHPTWAKLRFEIEDTGVGIPADRMDRLFDSFSQVDASTTRRYGGTGLGLAISKQLTDLMNGEIGVRSDVDRGTCFWIEVDLGTATEAGPAADASAAADDRRVLVAVEDPGLRASLVEQLRFLGWRPTVAENVAAARAACAGDRGYGAVIGGPWRDPDEMSALGGTVAEQTDAVRIALAGPGQILGDVAVRTAGYDGWLATPVRSRKLDDVLRAGRPPATGDGTGAAAGAFATAAAAPVSGTVGVEADGERLPLLLAEDNPVNQRVASLLLRKLGYEVEVVDNGAEAVAALARRRYALVLMDVQMPTMDGYEAVAHIRAAADGVLDPQVPVVALTAHAMKGDRQRCLDAGMDDYLSKPIDAAELAVVLNHHLGQRGAPEPAPVGA